ncbi:MAG: cell division protein FtsW [Phycisphaeraceae bacterium]|nr:cell division protein FtsW [Phycisphaeraceae bacterium]
MTDNFTVIRRAHIVQLAAMALLGLAVLMVHSASMSVDGKSLTPWTLFTSRYMLHALTAVLVMLFVSRLNTHRLLAVRGLANPVWIGLGIALILVIVAMLPGVGLTINGARRWLSLGPRSWGLTFQPSELVKWFAIAALAVWCGRRQAVLHHFFHGLLFPLAMIAVACGIVIVEDLGTAVLIGMVCVCLLIAAGARLWHLAMFLPPAVVGLGAAILHSPYRMQRLASFLHPWDDPQGSGYQAIQSLVAIAQGGFIGSGLGNGIQKYGYLPADTSDFLFAIICEELGLAGAALVIAAFLAIVWAGWGIALRNHSPAARLLSLGITLMVGLQALMNLGVVTVVLPTKGIALPLLSAGGTGWILTAAALGVLASLDPPLTEVELDAVPLAPRSPLPAPA